MKKVSTTQLLLTRGSTHGEFSENSQTVQQIKRLLRSKQNWTKMQDHHREALDMIVHKIGRIMHGNPEFKDHWRDISGYAKLTEERCKDA